MKLKSIALIASGIIAASAMSLAQAAPDQGCGAGSCSKKSKKQDAEQVQSGCSKKEANAQASCSKKE